VTAADLEAWRAQKNLSIREACRLLDVSQDRWRRWMAGGRIPAHIALACAALAFGLPPWAMA
jgi:transcriptional regulator with XRE-family HTH domain